MKLKLDENLGAQAARRLASAGHDVEDVHGERLCGRPDTDVLAAAVREDRDDPSFPDEFGEASPGWEASKAPGAS